MADMTPGPNRSGNQHLRSPPPLTPARIAAGQSKTVDAEVVAAAALTA